MYAERGVSKGCPWTTVDMVEGRILGRDIPEGSYGGAQSEQNSDVLRGVIVTEERYWTV